MIQDISPHKYDNTFTKKSPSYEDYVIVFHENKIVLKEENKIKRILKFW